MIDYSLIDPDLKRWAALKGYVVQTSYRDEEVRLLVIWSVDNSRMVQVGITKIDDHQVELTLFDGKKKRVKISAPKHAISQLLDESEVLAKTWLR